MKLSAWDAAVKKRRAGIVRALRLLKTAKDKKKVKASINDMMLYGVMDRHQRHWHKISGVWFLDTVRSRRARL